MSSRRVPRRHRADRRLLVLLGALLLVGTSGVLATAAAAETATGLEVLDPDDHDQHHLLALAAATDDEVAEVTRNLKCTCGCALTIAACEQSMTCTIAERMRADTEEFLATGMTSEEILAQFAADHGERILAAPTKEGFNLVAWIVPFAGLFAGLGVVVVVLTRWRSRSTTATAVPVAAPVSAYVDALEREIREGM